VLKLMNFRSTSFLLNRKFWILSLKSITVQWVERALKSHVFEHVSLFSLANLPPPGTPAASAVPTQQSAATSFSAFSADVPSARRACASSERSGRPASRSGLPPRELGECHDYG
jgi:hypothetical protein